MATRCQIKVEGQDAMLYKHSDGYPEGVLPTLTDAVEKFKEVRGFFDGFFLLARIGQRFMNDSDTHVREFAIKMGAAGLKSCKDEVGCLGYGYDTALHGDIEYLYTVHEDWSITVEEK